MSTTSLRIAVGLVLAVGMVLAPLAVRTAGTEPTSRSCDYVDLHVHDGMDSTDYLYLDLVNWTTATRNVFYMNWGDDAIFRMDPGWFEFYIYEFATDHQGGAWVNLPPCSKAAADFRRGPDGRLEVRLHVVLPD